MENTANLALPYIMPSQAQKHVTHNEALRMLDALVQLSALDRDRTAPPSAPAEGDRHIVAPAAEGPWEGCDGQIAAWQDGAWACFRPAEGWRVWVVQERALLVFHDGRWEPVGDAPRNLDMIGINADADAVNRLAVASEAVLLNHDGEGHQLKINKAAPGDTASLLFQTGFSGRAEMGAAGDDDFHIKVSGDGANWHEALVIDGQDGTLSTAAGSAATPVLKLGDADTGLYSPGPDMIGFATGGAAQAAFDASGRYLIGAVQAYSTRAGSNGTTSVTPRAQILSAGADASFMMSRFGNNSNGPFIFFTKSRGGLGTNETVETGDDLATFSFAGVAEGGEQGEAARIRVRVSAGPTAARTPGRIDFMTSDGDGVAAVRLSVDHLGNVLTGGDGVVIDRAGRPVLGQAAEYTAAQIGNIAHEVNTADKRRGTLVWDTTNDRMLRAAGAAADSPWRAVDGSTTVTPS